MELHLFTVFLPVVFGQIKPDVSFDQSNDRFDLTPLLREASYDQWGDVMNGVRRSGLSKPTVNVDESKVSEATKKFMDALRGFQRNFDFNTPENSDNENPEEKVQLRRDLVSYLHEYQPDMTRRSDQSELDREVLIHHAVPIVMTVEGIMQVPKRDK
ncbi:uncharacterized protein LOC133530257 [Cydia pomonella]|uniref:uncharacterized protein LOC133530257 n=1 Tax=Cydia pomonella TaxID=82600 RepID=UPI002ADE70B3|nr:uncharacterized protein LOC133530257 [Cydia pomonella]